MTFQADNFSEHYKAVRARLESRSAKKPVVVQRDILIVATIPKPFQAKVRARQIIEEVAAEYKILAGDITGRRRMKDIVRVRHIAISRVAIEFPNWTLMELGKLFNRDHTTILHAIRMSGAWAARAELKAQSPESFVEGLG